MVHCHPVTTEMRMITALMLIPIVSGWLSIIPSFETTRTLADSLCGEFSNAEQAATDARFASARVWFRPMILSSNADEIRNVVFDGKPTSDHDVGFALYQESALFETLGKPYKQSVVFVVLRENVIKLQSHKLEAAAKARVQGLARIGDDGPLNGITLDDLEPRQTGCDMIVKVDHDDVNMRFNGQFECQGGCRFHKANRDTYLDSSFELVLDGNGEVVHYLTEDRFFDVAGNAQVWGSEHGPFAFARTKRWGQGKSLPLHPGTSREA